MQTPCARSIGALAQPEVLLQRRCTVNEIGLAMRGRSGTKGAEAVALRVHHDFDQGAVNEILGSAKRQSASASALHTFKNDGIGDLVGLNGPEVVKELFGGCNFRLTDEDIAMASKRSKPR